jgi:hypothetical protein
MLLILFLAAATGAWAGDAPYLGTWKQNPAKNDYAEVTLTFEDLADGQTKMIADGQAVTFKADGKDYPTPWGDVTSWKVVDKNTWQSTSKVNGKVTSVSTMTLGADGKTLKVDSKSNRANGETSKSTAEYQRVSGTSGFAGKWKARNVNTALMTLVLAANGPDGVTLTVVEEKGTCSARFDGKDHPAKGPSWPTGWTCAIAKNGATGLDVTWKKDGRVMYQDSMSVSADGKVMTDVSNAPAASEKVKVVFDRQ